MGMLLLTHRGSLESTLNPTLRICIKSTNLTKRGSGEPLRLRACKEWLRSSSTTLGTTALHCRRLGVLIPLKGEN
jgi:hypothetical protein